MPYLPLTPFALPLTIRRFFHRRGCIGEFRAELNGDRCCMAELADYLAGWNQVTEHVADEDVNFNNALQI